MEDYEYNPSKPLSFLSNFSDEEWQLAKTNLFSLNTELTEDDVAYEMGKEEDFFERLQQKTGKSRNELINVIMQGQREIPQEKG